TARCRGASENDTTRGAGARSGSVRRERAGNRLHCWLRACRENNWRVARFVNRTASNAKRERPRSSSHREVTPMDACASDRLPRFPFPSFPTGWFALASSAELAPGDVKAIRALGRDLVLFRTQSGTACVVDAYCPHLGTHLGH